MIPTNGDEELNSERPRRNAAPSAALLAGQATIPSQRKAVEEFRALEAIKRAAATKLALEEARASAITPISSRDTSPIGSDTPAPPTSHKKRAYVEESSDNEEVDDTRENARTNPNPTGKFVFKI